MSELVALDPRRQLLDAARPVWGGLLVLSSLRFAWLIGFPLAFYYLGEAVWSVAPIVIGYALDVVGRLLAQRLRRSVRVRWLQQSGQRALEKSGPIPEANVDSAFWSAQLTETAIIGDVPAIISACAALAGILVLSFSRLGASSAGLTAGFLSIAVILAVLANRHRAPSLATAVTRRLATAEVLGAAERDAGEIAGPYAQRSYSQQVSRSADAWCRAQDRVERLRLAQHAVIGGLAAGALIWLASRHGVDLLGTRETATTTLRSASDLLLIGSGLPVARLLSGHLDSLLVARAALSKLQVPTLRTRKPSRALAARPRTLGVADLRFRYGDKLALDVKRCSIDLTEPLLVTGENGAGKTTLAAIIANVIEYREGTVHLDGVDVRELSGDDIAFVPQHPVFMLELSIAENAALIAPRASEAELREALAELGLERTLASPVKELSRGEQQRIAIARAFLKRPKLLVLDEPDAWLDHSGRGRLAAALARRADDTAIVLVTHREELIALRGTRLELPAGRLVARQGSDAAPRGSSNA